MALSRVHNWISLENLTASDLNAEFNNVLNYLNSGSVTLGGTLAVTGATTLSSTLAVTGLSTLTGGARTDTFTQASPTNNTYYTALSAASQATNAYLIWVYSSANVASSFYLLLYNPIGGNRVLTALSTGTEVGQLDGSSNFQIKTTASASSISASWLRLSS